MAPSFATIVAIFLIAVGVTSAFSGAGSISSRVRSNVISMEYIPDGLSKKQWEEMKKREIEDKNNKGSLGTLGTRKFKSRSFEAWQKSGGKHLFPVDPTNTPYEERPYMQRKDGDWEGKDLKQVVLILNYHSCPKHYLTYESNITAWSCRKGTGTSIPASCTRRCL
jgi:hypothetical protein